MKKALLPLLLSLLAVITFLVYSCNKQSGASLQEQKNEQAKEKEQIAARLAKEGIVHTIFLNQKLDYDFIDAQGHVFSKDAFAKKRSDKQVTAITSACLFNNNDIVSLQRIAISTGCNSGYQLSWTYSFSTNNNIVQTNPYNSAYFTKGQIQVYDASNTLTYSLDVYPATIVDLGADPARSGYELFTVSFATSTAINASYFASPYTFKMGAFIATDCPPDPNGRYQNLLFLIRPVTPLANICDRIDPIQTANLSPLRFYGEDPIGTCPSSLALPDLQEIQYSTNGGSTWVGGGTASGTLSYYLPPPSSGSPFANLLGSSTYGYVDPYGALELQITLPTGSYTVLVRSRNIHFSGALSSYPGSAWPIPNPGVNCCVGTWSATSSYSVTY